MPSRRSPVPMERARTSKSSATRTLTAVPRRSGGEGRWFGVSCAQRCQVAGSSQVAAADTGLEPGAAYNCPHETTPNRVLTPMSAPGIVVAGLRKRYGAIRALDGMSFTVHPALVTG